MVRPVKIQEGGSKGGYASKAKLRSRQRGRPETIFTRGRGSKGGYTTRANIQLLIQFVVNCILQYTIR